MFKIISECSTARASNTFDRGEIKLTCETSFDSINGIDRGKMGCFHAIMVEIASFEALSSRREPREEEMRS